MFADGQPDGSIVEQRFRDLIATMFDLAYHPPWTGWSDIQDTEHTDASPDLVTAGADPAPFTIDGGVIRDEQKPLDIPEFFSVAEQKILGRNGDGQFMFVEFVARPTGNGTSRLNMYIDIGTELAPIPLYRKTSTLSKGVNVDHYSYLVAPGYTLGTWEANGGKLFRSAEGNNVEIFEKRLICHRLHPARPVS